MPSFGHGPMDCGSQAAMLSMNQGEQWPEEPPLPYPDVIPAGNDGLGDVAPRTHGATLKEVLGVIAANACYDLPAGSDIQENASIDWRGITEDINKELDGDGDGEYDDVGSGGDDGVAPGVQFTDGLGRYVHVGRDTVMLIDELKDDNTKIMPTRVLFGWLKKRISSQVGSSAAAAAVVTVSK